MNAGWPWRLGPGLEVRGAGLLVSCAFKLMPMISAGVGCDSDWCRRQILECNGRVRTRDIGIGMIGWDRSSHHDSSAKSARAKGEVASTSARPQNQREDSESSKTLSQAPFLYHFDINIFHFDIKDITLTSKLFKLQH
jgi:hypothetical protein